MSKKRIATGVAVAALYVAVAQLSFRSGLVPTRPLYDGTGAVARYRWVNPPPSLVSGNTPPSGGAGTMQIGPVHTPAYNLNTDDNGQTSIIFPPDGVVPMPGQTSVKLVIQPLDPAKVASPPAGFDYDGNAYSITGTYEPSGKPAEIPNVTCSLTNANACATIVLRYAFTAVKLMRLDGTIWTEVPSQRATTAFQIYGNTNKLGTFVAVDVHTAGGPKAKGQTGNIIAFAVGLVAILVGTFLARVRATRKRRASEAGKSQKEQKGRPPKRLKPRKEARRRREEQEQKPWWRD